MVCLGNHVDSSVINFGNNYMSSKQGNCIGEASVILPIANAITSISHLNPCDSMLITVPSFFKTKKGVQLWK